MKQNNFFNKLKKQMKDFFKSFRNRNTGFFVIVVCVCLVATALIWGYTSSKNNESKISENQDNINPDSQEANKDPFEDYVDKTIEDYEKSLENEDEAQANRIIVVESLSKPIEGTIAKEFNINGLVYYETVEEWRTHQGLDILPTGNLTVNAAYGGKIESVENSGVMGYEIVIDHGQNVKSKYSCLSSVSVKAGDIVNINQKIGTLGIVENIEMAEGVHLHFELSVNDVIYDPTSLYSK